MYKNGKCHPEFNFSRKYVSGEASKDEVKNINSTLRYVSGRCRSLLGVTEV